MALPVPVQTGKNSASAITLTIGSGVGWVSSTAGNLLTVIIGWGGAATISSVIDNLSHSWTLIKAEVTGATNGAIYYYPSNPGGVTSLTITFSGTAQAGAIVDEFAVTITSPLDVSAINFGSGTTPQPAASGSTGITAQAVELIIGGYIVSGATPGISSENITGSFATELVGGVAIIGRGTLLASSTGTQSASFTATASSGTVGWVALVAAFKTAVISATQKDDGGGYLAIVF